MVFLAWALVGAGWVFGLLGALTIGVFVLVATIALAAVLLARPATRNRNAVGMISGGGVVLLYIAYLNRGGPGDVCTTTGTGSACSPEWSPWPFLAVGVALVVGGIVLARLTRGRSPESHAS